MHPDPWRFLSDSGLLFELNRLVLHPLGLALVLAVDEKTGVHTLHGIWDSRDDPEGICFEQDAYTDGAEKFAAYKRDHFVPRLPRRFKALGYLVQGQPGSSIAHMKTVLQALLDLTKDQERAHGLALELLHQLDPGASMGLVAHWKDEGGQLLIDLLELQEEGWGLFGYMPAAPERGVLPLGPLLHWIRNDPPPPPELPLPRLLGSVHGFDTPTGSVTAVLPSLERQQAVLARRAVAHPRALIESASEAYVDDAHGLRGGVVVRVQALVPREIHDELELDWGDAGGPGDRLIAETARRVTGLTAPLEVAEALAREVGLHRAGDVQAEPSRFAKILAAEYAANEVLVTLPGEGPITTTKAVEELTAATPLGATLGKLLFQFGNTSSCPDGRASIGTPPADPRAQLYGGKVFLGEGRTWFRVDPAATHGVLRVVHHDGARALTSPVELERRLVMGEIRPPERGIRCLASSPLGLDLFPMAPEVAALTKGKSAAQFAKNTLRLSLWGKQEDVLRALDLHPKVLVTHGHKSGLTYAAAAAALWWFWSVEGGQVLVLGETDRQLAIVFDPILRALERTVSLQPTAIEQRRLLYAHRGNAVEACEALGHAATTFIVVDGAGRLGDEIGAALDRAATFGARVLAFDVARQDHAWFYEASKSPDWHRIVVSSEDVPNVVEVETLMLGLATRAWIDEKRTEWGPLYERHPLYRSRVLGLFPLEQDP